VDRVLTVIEGEGLLLTVDDRMLALDAASPPLDFLGETQVVGAPDRRTDQRPERDGAARTSGGRGLAG
jgi:environmental stress-induced protein Ves